MPPQTTAELLEAWRKAQRASDAAHQTAELAKVAAEAAAAAADAARRPRKCGTDSWARRPSQRRLPRMPTQTDRGRRQPAAPGSRARSPLKRSNPSGHSGWVASLRSG